MLSVPGLLDSDGSDVAAGVPEHKLHAGFPWSHLLRREGSWLGEARLSMPVTRPISATLLAPSPTDLGQTIRATSRNPFCVPSRSSRVRPASSIQLAFFGGERIPHLASFPDSLAPLQSTMKPCHANPAAEEQGRFNDRLKESCIRNQPMQIAIPKPFLRPATWGPVAVLRQIKCLTFHPGPVAAQLFGCSPVFPHLTRTPIMWCGKTPFSDLLLRHAAAWSAKKVTWNEGKRQQRRTKSSLIRVKSFPLQRSISKQGRKKNTGLRK